MKKNNNSLISYVVKTDLYDLQEKEVQDLAIRISKDVNLSQLRKTAHKVTLELSRVGEPRFGADMKSIINEDSQRLYLIYQLNYNLEIFEGWVKNLRKNKYNCLENHEALFNLLIYTQDMMETILEYGEFKMVQREEVQKQLETKERYLKVLEGGKKNANQNKTQC